MKRLGVMRMGRLGLLLGLCVACNGRMRSLGEEDGMTGGSGGTTFGTTTKPGKGGSAGQAFNTGGTTWRQPVLGAAGRLPAESYLQEPTVPIDPTCPCSSPDQICNALRQCVNRCDSAKRCAMWLSDRAVKDLYVDGSTLFFLVGPKTDPLGNPVSDGALYRVEYPDGTPTLVTELTDPRSILGRYAGATFVTSVPDEKNPLSYSTVRIDDTPSKTTVAESAASMRGSWLTYVDSTGTKLWGIDLERGLTPVQLVDLATITDLEGAQSRTIVENLILDDYFWFDTYGGANNTHWLCHLSRSNISISPACAASEWASGYNIVATNGNTLFGVVPMSSNSVESLDIAGKVQLRLFSGGYGSLDRTESFGGWLYSSVNDVHRLVRYPATVGRLPQVVLPDSVAYPAFYGLNESNQTGDFTVSSIGVFWYQGVDDPNTHQYIFHAPLPSLPCDADLPCPKSDGDCLNGMCSFLLP